MRVNKGKGFFVVVTNEAGKIIKLSKLASSVLRTLVIGDDIFSVINADTLRKLSMYKSKMILASTELVGYPYAFMRSKSRRGITTIEICFLAKGFEQSTERAEKILSLYGGDTITRRAMLCLSDYIKGITKDLMAQRSFEGAVISIIENDTQKISINPRAIELIALTSISVLRDISFKGKITICASNTELSFTLDTKERVGDDLQALCTSRPYIASRLYLIRGLCEDAGVDFSLHTQEGGFVMNYALPKSALRALSLNASYSAGAKERISTFINILFA